MSLWIAVISVALINAAFKAAGPAVLGQHDIPPASRRLVAMLPAAVLTALVVADVIGGRWAHIDWHLAAGVGAAATARLFRAPMLAAILVGVAVTAGLRAIA
jgi:branched-subunit amino acid transport protein